MPDFNPGFKLWADRGIGNISDLYDCETYTLLSFKNVPSIFVETVHGHRGTRIK